MIDAINYDAIGWSFISLCLALLTMLVFYIAIKERELVDRYRLKYGFDKNIESKFIGNMKNMDKREELYKKRVYLD